MANYKGTGIVFLREWVEGSEWEFKHAFLASLSPEEKTSYQTALAVSWLPVACCASLFEKWAKVRFPGDPEGLFKIGRKQGENDLKGIYKIMLRLASIPMILKQSPKLWNMYFDQGKASACLVNLSSGRYQVEDFPNLPFPSREVARGYMAATFELAKVTVNVHEAPDSSPASWKWNCQWNTPEAG